LKFTKYVRTWIHGREWSLACNFLRQSSGTQGLSDTKQMRFLFMWWARTWLLCTQFFSLHQCIEQSKCVNCSIDVEKLALFTKVVGGKKIIWRSMFYMCEWLPFTAISANF
jgi:hypothetical protein